MRTMPAHPRHVIIFHGYAENPSSAWFPWLVARLRKQGMHVSVPTLHNSLRPSFKEWVAVAERELADAPKGTIVIGHSLGGVIALRAIARTRKKVAGVMLIGSPFCSTIKVDILIQFFSGRVNWRSLRSLIGRTTVVHAEDDPLVPYDHAFRYAENLGATLVLRKKGRHFTQKTSAVLLKEITRMLRA